jgi:hypothetical protein
MHGAELKQLSQVHYSKKLVGPRQSAELCRQEMERAAQKPSEIFFEQACPEIPNQLTALPQI